MTLQLILLFPGPLVRKKVSVKRPFLRKENAVKELRLDWKLVATGLME